MDYDLDNENKGLAKGPFYGAAAFIFIIVVLFASVSLQEQGKLDHWQIATCFLGTGLIAVFLFLPYFLEGFVERIENLISNHDSDSISKTIFELKEIRSELNALALKIDKVPTLVDKIVSESIDKTTDEGPDTVIVKKLKDLESNMQQKLDLIEQNTLTNPLLPQPDPNELSLKESLEKLNQQLALLQNKFDQFRKSSKLSLSTSPSNQDDEQLGEGSSADIPDKEHSELPTDDETPEGSENLQELVEEGKEEADNPLDDLEEPDDSIASAVEPDEETEEMNKEKETEENSSSSVDEGDGLEPDDFNSPEIEESIESGITEVQKTEEELPQELDLGLPSPEETLRKVDALLAGKENTEVVQKSENTTKQAEKNGTTTVVANVMIGIGNKPYLRGEGPGLSWDEGVSMNFVEIGKWAWSPPRKNASLTVQVYRNDQDPDKGGKVEVKPGQKLEITPDFS